MTAFRPPSTRSGAKARKAGPKDPVFCLSLLYYLSTAKWSVRPWEVYDKLLGAASGSLFFAYTTALSELQRLVGCGEGRVDLLAEGHAGTPRGRGSGGRCWLLWKDEEVGEPTRAAVKSCTLQLPQRLLSLFFHRFCGSATVGPSRGREHTPSSSR